MELLHSPRTAVHLVTMLEEMPVQETADAVSELTALNLPIGSIIVNQVRPARLDEAQQAAARADEIDHAELENGLKAAGLAAHEGLSGALLRGATAHVDRLDLEARERLSLQQLSPPLVELPWLADGVDLAALYEIADLLGEHSHHGASW
jgi:anion-transporting  ArsA/GET3 family ATPase